MVPVLMTSCQGEQYTRRGNHLAGTSADGFAYLEVCAVVFSVLALGALFWLQNPRLAGVWPCCAYAGESARTWFVQRVDPSGFHVQDDVQCSDLPAAPMCVCQRFERDGRERSLARGHQIQNDGLVVYQWLGRNAEPLLNHDIPRHVGADVLKLEAHQYAVEFWPGSRLGETRSTDDFVDVQKRLGSQFDLIARRLSARLGGSRVVGGGSQSTGGNERCYPCEKGEKPVGPNWRLIAFQPCAVGFVGLVLCLGYLLSQRSKVLRERLDLLFLLLVACASFAIYCVAVAAAWLQLGLG